MDLPLLSCTANVKMSYCSLQMLDGALRNGTTMSEKRKIFSPWLPLFQMPNTLPKCSSFAIFSSLNWFSFLSLPYSYFQLSPVPKCLSRHFLLSPHLICPLARYLFKVSESLSWSWERIFWYDVVWTGHAHMIHLPNHTKYQCELVWLPVANQ